mmetsp:Transcript_98238/g.184738  ORF Transcript_98238/g.184738 Transcript_98238/m.184738 type:complete len:357 (+) Transcript_98238:47-1117(+)
MTVPRDGPALPRTDSQACALEERGVSDDLMLEWEVREDRALGNNFKGNCQYLCHEEGQAIRQACLQCMLRLSEEIGLEMKGWIMAVTLLDVQVASGAGQGWGSDRHLPVACVAIVRLVKKVDDALFYTSEFDFSAYVSLFAELLEKSGMHIPSETISSYEEMLQDEELRILQAANWQIQIPTVESWLSAFCARFSVLTRDIFMNSLVWIWQQGIALTGEILRQYTVTAEMPPRRVARGLISLLFVASNMLPLSMFQPPQITEQDWQELFVSSLPMVVSVPDCKLPEGRCRCITDILQAATCTELAVLCEDVFWLAKLMHHVPDQDKLAQKPNVKLAHAALVDLSPGRVKKLHHSAI